MANNDLNSQKNYLKKNLILWTTVTVVIGLASVALLVGLGFFAPREAEERHLADEELSNETESDSLYADDNNAEADALARLWSATPTYSGTSSVPAPPHSEQMSAGTHESAASYEINEQIGINRAKAYGLEMEWNIDLLSETNEFIAARQEWDDLIGRLLTSEDGRRLALDEELLDGFIELYRKRPLRPEWADAMRRQADHMIQPVIATIQEKYSQPPSIKLRGEFAEIQAKLASEIQMLTRDSSTIRGLVARAPRTIPVNAPTLAQAMVDYNARRDSQEFLDERDLEKQAAEEARLMREEQIRQQQRENMAISADLQAQTERLREEAEQIASQSDQIQQQREELSEDRVEIEATRNVVEEKEQEIRQEWEQARSAPSRADLEASANFSFSLAGYFRPDSERWRGGVIHVDYNGMLAPRGTEACDVWRSADGQYVYVHSGGVTLGFRASSVQSIVNPSSSSTQASSPTQPSTSAASSSQRVEERGPITRYFSN
jgi:hypothetical protein